jgi:hypothetical protein
MTTVNVPFDEALARAQGWIFANSMPPPSGEDEPSLGAFSILLMTGFFWAGVVFGIVGSLVARSV